MVCVTRWDLYFEKSADPVWMETRDFLIAAPPASFCRCRKLFFWESPRRHQKPARIVPLQNAISTPSATDLLFSPRLFSFFVPNFLKILIIRVFTDPLFSCSLRVQGIFYSLFNEKVGCNSRYLDLEDRLDTEILISFRDSSLSLLYIIVVSKFVEIFLFRNFITMQIEYIDRYIF